MTREELEKKFIELGLPEGAARIYAEKEQQNKKDSVVSRLSFCVWS